MMFAFHTVEAYINFVGENLAPKLWDNEQNSFRKEPYRGWNGKLRKVLELVNIDWTPDLLQQDIEVSASGSLNAGRASARAGAQTAHIW